jgi:hypothetical protein
VSRTVDCESDEDYSFKIIQVQMAGAVIKILSSKHTRVLFSEFLFMKKKLRNGGLCEDDYFFRTIKDHMIRFGIEKYIESHRPVVDRPAISKINLHERSRTA